MEFLEYRIGQEEGDGAVEAIVNLDAGLVSSSASSVSTLTNSESAEVGNKRKRSSNSSWGNSNVWDYFDEAGKDAVKYKCCKPVVLLNMDKSRSTSHIRRHIRSNHVNPTTPGSNQADISTFMKVDLKNPFMEKVLRWLIHTAQPFSSIMNPFFRDMCQQLNSKAPIISKDSIRDLLKLQTIEAKKKMTQVVCDEYVSITSDGLTSKAVQSNTVVTCHWISENFELKNIPLACTLHSGSAKAENHVDDVMELLASYGIMASNIVAMITDTEPTMTRGGILVEERELAERHCCIDHILETITEIAFNDTPHSAHALARARALVGIFHKSSQAKETLLACQPEGINGNKLGLVADVATRWWSTYSMCQRLVDMKDSLQQMATAFPHLLPPDKVLTDEDWAIIVALAELLKPLLKYQKLLESEQYVTISMVVLVVVSLARSLRATIADPASAEHVKVISTKMLQKLCANFGTLTADTVWAERLTRGSRQGYQGFPRNALLAYFLDPRTKSMNKLSPRDRKDIKQCIQEEQLKEYDRIYSKCEERPPSIVVDVERDILVRELQKIIDYDEYVDFKSSVAISSDIPRRNVFVQDEMKRYELQSGLKLVENPLLWWKERRLEFPTLAALARKYLATPATSAPSERVFSRAGITISRFRTRMLPQNAESSIFLHFALPFIDGAYAANTLAASDEELAADSAPCNEIQLEFENIDID